MKVTSKQRLPRSYVSTTFRQFFAGPSYLSGLHLLHSQYTPVSLQFIPLLEAYFVPEDFYLEGEVLTMPVPTHVALQVDIRSLSEDQKYSVFVDDTNTAKIEPEAWMNIIKKFF